MKKWMKFTLVIIGGIAILFVIDLICIFTINKPLFAIKDENGDSVNLIYRGLFYDTYNCFEYPSPQIKSKGSKFSCAIKNVNISLEDINDKIINYISNDKNIKDICVYNYVDSLKNKVVVGLVDNTKEKQEEFITKVYSECCGSRYIEYIKNNSIIEFNESKYTFEAKIVVVKDDNIIVEVLKDTEQFKKNDKVTMKITIPTNGTNDFYVVGNKVKITFKGMILTSNPAQIDVINVELIK